MRYYIYLRCKYRETAICAGPTIIREGRLPGPGLKGINANVYLLRQFQSLVLLFIIFRDPMPAAGLVKAIEFRLVCLFVLSCVTLYIM
jgi:hypothetical protein